MNLLSVTLLPLPCIRIQILLNSAFYKYTFWSQSMLPPNVNFIVTVRWVRQTIILGSVNIFVAMTKYTRKEKRACLVSVYKLLDLLSLSPCVWVRIHLGASLWGLWESFHERIHIKNLGATQNTLLFLVE